ncbi:hypothetical protein H5410_045731, partial [Solanum commersonii]
MVDSGLTTIFGDVIVILDIFKSMKSITLHIIINQARTMNIYIREMMPSIIHKLCQCHIANNALSYLSSLKNDK